jgi:hypothetical protein
MSEVVSFRLNKDNPREAQARAVLKAWVDKGYGIRYVLTEALLAYQNSQRDVDIRELSMKLEEISNLLRQNGTPSKQEDSNNMLSDSFMASIRKTAKSGTSLG